MAESNALEAWWKRLWKEVKKGFLGNDDEVRTHLDSGCRSPGWHIVYWVYRVLLCVYCWVVLGCWLFSDVNLNHNVLAYLTTWIYITICIYLLLTALALIPCQSRPLRWMGCQILWWWSANISLIFGISVTSVAHIFKIDKDDWLNFPNFNVHTMNTVIMVTDTVISKRTMKVCGFLPPILYGLAYVIYNVIYTFADDLETPIYSFLDWKNSVAFSIGITFGILAALIGIHFAIYIIRCIIYKICNYCCKCHATCTRVQGPTEATPLV